MVTLRERILLLYQMFVMGKEITAEIIKKTGMSGKRWERVVKHILSRLKFS
ncbi:hypothetical protein [Moorena sp. SIO4G3]|uniref:hypothetical protein n=1 Tax=Moorena sp. SIO4G3 TaxID=2607821 RepID=UPI00142A1A36|nr:hypothetical protein [Moorena sp. SIO4G3]NEO77548.1 hypothetical protein [Moorena sp. SIO4G3]